MSSEMFPFNDDEFESCEVNQDSIDRFWQEEAEREETAAVEASKKSFSRAMRQAREVLMAATISDKERQGTNVLRTKRLKVRSAGSDDYPFKHDRVILVPRRSAILQATKRIMRFAVPEGDPMNIKPNYIFITDFYGEDEAPRNYVLTDVVAGDDEDLTLDIENGYLKQVTNINKDPEFSPDFFAENLLSFELEEQGKKSPAA